MTPQKGEVYIGAGHFSHRFWKSKWASPFVVGQHGAVEECLIMYTDHIVSSELVDCVDESAGKTLLSDTPLHEPCAADVLIALV